MYYIYEIYKVDELVFITYHNLNINYSDKTKLDLILNSPIIPYSLVDSYFRTPHLLSIKMIKTELNNILEAQQTMSDIQSKKKAKRIKRNLERL